MRLLCLGHSYTGRYLHQAFPEHEVHFLSRSAEELRREGTPAVPESQFESFVEERPIEAVVDTVPALKRDDGGIDDPPYFGQVERVVETHPSCTVVHLSSTSVYPGGGTHEREKDVPTYNEASEAVPTKARGLYRMLLERRWIDFQHQTRLVRSGGIYGPGRCLALRFWKGDFRRVGTGNKMVSRIHVHDLCRLILEAAGQPEKNAIRVLNAVDAYPAFNKEVFAWIEEELDIIIPGDWRVAPPSGRRIESLYALKLLGGEGYRFPSYREGFRECLKDHR